MSNLLNNPKLDGFTLGRYFTDREGKVGTIENPNGWEFVAYPRQDDPNKLPESLHRDNEGFVISAAYIAWEGGFVQSGIQLTAGQRYLAKAVFKPDVNFPGGQPADLTAVTWRFVVGAGESKVEQDWQVTGKGQYKQREENLFVFEAAQNMTVDVTFMARSFYASNDCDLWVYELALEPVGADYGGASVPVLGTATTSQPDESEIVVDSVDVQTEVIPMSMVEDLTTATGPSGKALGDVLNATEIDQIAAGLRALALTATPSASIGLNTLADAFERLK